MVDTVLGTFTIGQAPRPDVTPILDQYVPASVKRFHRGGKWKALECPPIFAAANPYTATPDALAAAGVSLARRGAEALLLDCIGFTQAHRAQLAHASRLPVILSNALMAKIVGEMVAA